MILERLFPAIAAVLAVGCAEPALQRAEAPGTARAPARERPFRARPAPTDDAWLRSPPSLLPMRPATAPPVVERRLANGARVLVVERHDFPSVALAFVLDRGVCDAGAAAALYSHAFGSSSADGRAANLSYLNYIAAPFRMTVADDYIVLSSTVLSPLLPSAVSRLAPMFFAPGVSAEDLAYARRTWKGVLSAEGARSGRLATRMLRESLFGRGGYGTVLVDPAEIDSEPDARVRELRRVASSPRHATVVAVGDTTPDAIVRMLDEYTRDLPRDEVGPSGCAALPVPPTSAMVRIVDDPGATQSRVTVGAVGVPVGHADGAALDVLSAALGASLSSRLNLKIREEHGFSYGVLMHSQQWRAHGLLTITTSVETGRAAEAVKGILSELDRAAEEPLDEQELLGAKTRTFPDAGSHDDAGELLVRVAAYGRPADDVTARAAALANVTARDVTNVAGRYLAPERRVVTIVGDAALIATALGELGLGRVVVEKR